jgi:hypothetical protein
VIEHGAHRRGMAGKAVPLAVARLRGPTVRPRSPAYAGGQMRRHTVEPGAVLDPCAEGPAPSLRGSSRGGQAPSTLLARGPTTPPAGVAGPPMPYAETATKKILLSKKWIDGLVLKNGLCFLIGF